MAATRSTVNLLEWFIVLFTCVLTVASHGEAVFSAGPGSYANLTFQVEELKAMGLTKRSPIVRNQGIREKTRINKDNMTELCCGVYFCDQDDFRGKCFWGCYPEYHEIFPEGWWVINIVSVGPDPGVKVYLSGGECVVQGPWDKIHYPGKNLKEEDGLRKRVGCFYAAYQPA